MRTLVELSHPIVQHPIVQAEHGERHELVPLACRVQLSSFMQGVLRPSWAWIPHAPKIATCFSHGRNRKTWLLWRGEKKVLSSKQLRQVTNGKQHKQVGSGRWVWGLWRLLHTGFSCQLCSMTPDPLLGSSKTLFGTPQGDLAVSQPPGASQHGRKGFLMLLVKFGKCVRNQELLSVVQCCYVIVCLGLVPTNACEIFCSPLCVHGWAADISLSKGLACWTGEDAVRLSFGCFAPAWGQSEMSYCWDMIWSDGVNLVN